MSTAPALCLPLPGIAATNDVSSDTKLLARAVHPVEWVPLPSGRLGMPLSCNKRCIYLAADGRTRLCEHGETATTISQYATGSRKRPADSTCTCMNVDGLTAGRFKQAPQGWPGAPSYYDVLVARNMEEVELPGGRVARRMPYKTGACVALMLPDGNMRCQHGNSESTLRSIGKPSGKPKAGADRRPCTCRLAGRSWRRGRLQTAITQRAF